MKCQNCNQTTDPRTSAMDLETGKQICEQCLNEMISDGIIEELSD